MKITKLNYEVFIIDYIEGNLSAEAKTSFDNFLVKHPELRNEIATYLEAPVLEEKLEILYPNKKQHYKSDKRPYWNIAVGLLFLLLLCTALFYYNTSIPISKTKGETTLTDNTIAHISKSRETISDDEATMSTKKKSTKALSSQSKDELPSQNVSRPNSIARQQQDITKIPNPIVHKFSDKLPVKMEKIVQTNSSRPIAQHRSAQNSKRAVIETVAPLPGSGQELLVSVNQGHLLTEKIKMVYLLDDPNDLALVSHNNRKSHKWWHLFAPKAYQDFNLKGTLSSKGLKTTASEIGNSLKPNSIITK